jgi:poly(A) polymerase
MAIPHEHIDSDAAKVLRRLQRYHFTAYLVGGCVRDLLLARTPKDFDVATSATPNEIKDLFRNCRIIGRRFRLAHIFFGAKIIETSTFRTNPREGIEGEDFDGEELLIRRDNVFGTAEEDARRRDFTINGLFYDMQADQVIDYVRGLPDLEQRLVRTIGDPDIRFREDPVRILRAIKFAARLGFTIEPATYRAILTHRGEISKCAPPRILEELYRLMRGGAAHRSIELLRETGVLGVLVPELDKLIEAGAQKLPREPVGDGDGVTDAAAPLPPTDVLWRYLDALDDRMGVKDMEQPTNAVLLGALLLPFVPELLAPDAPRGADGMAKLEAIAKPVLERMRVSRRDAERTRQVLLAQRRLVPSRRRRGRSSALLSRDYFVCALELLELAASVDDSLTSEAARWRRVLREGPGNATAAGEDGAPGGKRRRRRRRGGRRRKGGAVAGSGQPVEDRDAARTHEEPGVPGRGVDRIR